MASPTNELSQTKKDLGSASSDPASQEELRQKILGELMEKQKLEEIKRQESYKLRKLKQ